MYEVSKADEYHASAAKVDMGVVFQILPYQPRRRGLRLFGDTASGVVVWPRGDQLALGLTPPASNLPMHLEVNKDGALVQSEWYALAPLADGMVWYIEVWGDASLETQTPAAAPGKCYKLTNGAWQEMVNGAFPQSSADTVAGVVPVADPASSGGNGG